MAIEYEPKDNQRDSDPKGSDLRQLHPKSSEQEEGKELKQDQTQKPEIIRPEYDLETL